MDINKIVWSEGMFLTPQHFQQQERYFEQFVRDFAFQITPNSYGLTDLQLDLSLLNIGKVGVRYAKGIFPDGTPFEINQGEILTIPHNTSNKLVYLALPLVRSGSVIVGEDNMHFRYVSKEQSAYDNSREKSDAVDLETAKLNVLLKLESDELEDYTLLPVAKILEYKNEGEVLLDQNFIPMCLHFAVSSYLKENMLDIFSQMQYRANTVSNRLHAENSSKSYQALTKDLLWLQALNGWLPRIKNWSDAGVLLTKDLYTECISIVGQMRGLEGLAPTESAPWSYNNLYQIFSQVFADISLLLNEVKFDNVSSLDWDTSLFNSRRLLRTYVQDRSLFENGRFILVAISSIGAAKLSETFPKASKLSGNSDIAELVRNALSGVPLRNLPYAPSELKSKNDAAYFELDTQSELWTSMVEKDEPIALHIDERIEDIIVEFHVIR